MRNIATVLLVLLLSLSATAQNTNLIENMVSVLNNQSLSGMVGLVTKEGYSEVSNPLFAQKNLRVFKKKTRGNDETYILEYCGSTLTGYYTTLSRPEYMIMLGEVEKKGYKNAEDNYYKYYKGDVSIEVVSDYSVVNSSAQSDAFGKATKYVHVARKNQCGQSALVIPSEREFNFHPSSLQACLANVKLKQSEVAIALAKSAFFVGGTDAATGVEQYVKDETGVTLQYCEGVVKAFMLFLPKSDGDRLVESLKKEGFKMTQEKTGNQNAFSRAYETDTYAAVLTYYGDANDEEGRDYAYQLAFAKKATSCK
jgi:hypothetical protein